MNAMIPPAHAQPATVDSPELEEQQQYLTFMLRGETYAISILRIKEIIQYGQLTEVPRMPDFIRGVINLRGALATAGSTPAAVDIRAVRCFDRNCLYYPIA
ncbi:MAG: chemotaxis protein CheW [Methylobacter sp.]